MIRCVLILIVILVGEIEITDAGKTTGMLIMNGYIQHEDGIGSLRLRDPMNWSDCISTCYWDPECVVVFTRSESSKICRFYNSTRLIKIQLQDDISTQSLVALKKETTNNCSFARTSTSRVSMHGSTPSENYIVNWNDTTNQLIFENAPQTCPDGWKTSTRNLETWCMRMEIVPSGINRHESFKECHKYNASLAGIVSEDESIFMSRMLRNYPNLTDFRQVWVDGRRTVSCQDKTGKPTCDVFEWSSTLMNGSLNNSFFADGQPSGDFMNRTENCVSLFSVANSIYDGFKTLNDIECSIETNGYVCGKIVG